ncbi:transposable element Tc1 transposase [Trichonephila clavipes]|nr:transposable element Tc1 transposase [Trichonephila clavipes]
MPRGRHRFSFDQFSEFERPRTVAYRDCGLSFREIGQRVRRNQAILVRICHRCMLEEMTDRRGRLHPSRCITALDDRQIVNMSGMDLIMCLPSPTFQQDNVRPHVARNV